MLKSHAKWKCIGNILRSISNLIENDDAETFLTFKKFFSNENTLFYSVTIHFYLPKPL